MSLDSRVTDGARTRDSRSHNPSSRSSIPILSGYVVTTDDRRKPQSSASIRPGGVKAIVSLRDAETAEWLLLSVCERLGLLPEWVRADGEGKRSAPVVARARREWFTGLWASGWAYAHIGRVCGFDHTTVMYAVRKELAS